MNDEQSFHAAVKYVLDNQGDPMECYDGRDPAQFPRTTNKNEPEA